MLRQLILWQNLICPKIERTEFFIYLGLYRDILKRSSRENIVYFRMYVKSFSVNFASKRNEYHEYFFGVKAAGGRANNITTFMCRLS